MPDDTPAGVSRTKTGDGLPRFYVPVNGIMARAQGTVEEWQFVFARRVQRDGSDDATPYAYARGIIPAPGEDARHRANIARIIGERADEELHVVPVGHSHGCRLILDAFAADPFLDARCIDLVAGAAPADCDANGINLICERGQVGIIRVWASARDDVLPWARASMGLYGTLGLDGPRNLRGPARDRVRVYADDTQTHGSWFWGAAFDSLYRAITGPFDGPVTLPLGVPLPDPG